MTNILIPDGINLSTVVTLLTEEVREPSGYEYGGSPIRAEPPYTVVFSPDLTGPEQSKVDNILARLNAAKGDYEQLGQIRIDILAAKDALTTYYNLASPTQVQSVAAIKKIIEVLNLFLRLFLIILDYLRSR